jgi:hypothetical protein
MQQLVQEIVRETLPDYSFCGPLTVHNLSVYLKDIRKAKALAQNPF